MTTDLETRLRRYGPTLDHAANPQRVPAATPRRRSPDPAAVVELEFSRSSDQSRRRARSLVAAAGLVAAASVAFVALVSQRNDGPSAPAASPDAPAPDTLDTPWQMQLAKGVTPWFEADSDTMEALQLQSPEPGPAQQQLRCTSWTAENGTVTCNLLSGQGYLPAVTYARNGDGYVDISTLHDTIGAATYATDYSQGKDVGYEAAPLPQQDVTINGAPGRLIETDNGIRRVTWSPQPGILVALETGPGLTRDDLFTIADHITPATALPVIPLVLAIGTDDDGRQAFALGNVLNGETCLITTEDCRPQLHGTPERPNAESPPAIYTQPTGNGIAGLATGDIATIHATRSDGTTTEVELVRQPIGATQAFAIVTDTALTLTATDSDGNPIESLETAAVPEVEQTVPTTISTITSP